MATALYLVDFLMSAVGAPAVHLYVISRAGFIDILSLTPALVFLARGSTQSSLRVISVVRFFRIRKTLRILQLQHDTVVACAFECTARCLSTRNRAHDEKPVPATPGERAVAARVASLCYTISGVIYVSSALVQAMSTSMPDSFGDSAQDDLGGLSINI